MPSRFRLSGFTAIAVTIAHLAAASIAADAAEPKQLILQVEHEGAGKAVITIAPDCIKLSAPAFGADIVAKAPSWKVSVFHPKDRTIFHCKLKDVKGIDTTGLRGNYIFAKPTLEKKASGEVYGLPATTYQIAKSAPPRVALLLDDSRYPAQTAELICRSFQLPHFDKIPLAYCTPSTSRVITTKAGERAPWNFDYSDSSSRGFKFRLRTISAKFVPFNKADYEVPRGYRVVKSSMNIFLSKTQQSELTDLIKEIGFQTKTGKDSTQNTTSSQKLRQAKQQ